MARKPRKAYARKLSPTPRAAGAGARKPAISRRELDPIRRNLEVMRQDLIHAVRQKEIQEVGVADAGDEADQATSSLEKEMLFELTDNERGTLDQIEGALRKMEKGIYGLCESCQKPIAKPRLKAVPFARYCIQCQSSAESAVTP